MSEENSLGMTLVTVPPGVIRMGEEPVPGNYLEGGDWDEVPVHDVEITRAFLMADTPVTNAQYERFDPSHKSSRGIRGVSQGDGEAAVNVSWNDAMAFCRWLSGKEGRPCRLPTEAEWEYACRAGTVTAFHTGNDLPVIYHRNQFKEGDWHTEGKKKDEDLREKKGRVPVSLEVGTTPANSFGIHDMHGLVEEWCLDWYGSYAPEKQKDPIGPSDGLTKVTRGGSHNSYVRHLRSANRLSALPEDRHWLIGFRVVQEEFPTGRTERPATPTLWDSTVKQENAGWTEPRSE